ncbi:putative quinol monooxygenase [Streptomyces sp. NPDC048275]|uniref:putative quinol monooxygenase n=1 Tax=Streptomyces sp. NPDC048275 TaxID=3155629 RepID=UPI0033F3BB47
MSPLTNAAFVRAKPDWGEDLGQRLLALVAPTRQEEGCLRYEVYQSNEDENAWFIFEMWKSAAAFDFHMRTPYVTEFLAQAPQLTVGEIEIRPHRMRSPL